MHVTNEILEPTKISPRKKEDFETKAITLPCNLYSSIVHREYFFKNEFTL
jgi:hypothetical protein